MFLKNKAARLITINADGKSYQILPGNHPAVDVPDEVCKRDFVKALLHCGDLVRESAPEVEEADQDGELEVLRELCAEAGVKVDKRWGVERLREELDKAE
jgi:hypothetical protein